jgi:hypothetical protein
MMSGNREGAKGAKKSHSSLRVFRAFAVKSSVMHICVF